MASKNLDDSGSATVEYAIIAVALIPILLFGALALYDFDSGESPSGSIVERGEASLTPVKRMSPTSKKVCGEGGKKANWCY